MMRALAAVARVAVDASAERVGAGWHVRVVVASAGVLGAEPWYEDELAELTRRDLERLATEAMLAYFHASPEYAALLEDADVHAARELVREISGKPDAELVPGFDGACCCPIAVSLAAATGLGALDYERLCADPEAYAALVRDGGPEFWSVDGAAVICPAAGARAVRRYSIDEFRGDGGDPVWFTAGFDRGEFPDLRLSPAGARESVR